MSATEFRLTEDKYLFTFQDETQLWIPREFIEKYQQFPFYDIIEHSDKYEDGSYYIDMPSFSMDKVIHFLMDDNTNIDSLNLQDGFDIYKIILDYSVTIDKEIQSDLLLHIKECFYNYMKKNKYFLSKEYGIYNQLKIYQELFSSDRTLISINGLFTPQRKEEFLHYSLLINMMNITTIEIIYDYSSNIPLEYICPSCIQDIFPSLKEIKITVTTHYKETNQLLNPNSDEYIMEYAHLLYNDEHRISKHKKYEYYTESEMNEYNKISSLDPNKLYYSHDLIDSYNEKRRKNQLPKLYKYIINEAIYTNDNSKVEMNETEDEYTLDDEVRIKYDGIINKVSTEHDLYDKIDPMFFMKLFEEGVFDSLTILSVKCIKETTKQIDDNMFMNVMTTHVFPNVTEFIYDDKDNGKLFELSSLTKECFPKLHIINYDIEIDTNNYQSLFPVNIISMIDTIRTNGVSPFKNEEIAIDIYELAYTHSIHIDMFSINRFDYIYNFPHLKELLEKDLISIHRLITNSCDSDNIAKLDYLKDSKQSIDELIFVFENNEYNDDMRNSLERFFKSNLLQHLNYFYFNFYGIIRIDRLMWISTLFNENKFNSIHELTIYLEPFKEDLSLEYFTILENLMEKLISKASVVTLQCNYLDISCYMSFINRLISKGCFLNTTQLNLDINDIPSDNFCKLYTADNFPQLKSIKIYKNNRESWSSFIETIYTYMNNNNFPWSSFIRLENNCSNNDYIYDPNNSILRYKYDTNTFMNAIIGTEDIYDEEQLSKLINFITTGKIPQLEEFIMNINKDISDEISNIYKQQLSDSLFIQENHVSYEFDTFY
ncbi:hypothetical protein WA158_000621 [Blastocystis sp. Blastoise]